ncbi:hypothetical protein [Nitrosomonas halophila]|uniref:hypothetical protein n=1 Tax=Nitrosomonas halophila TaxID=44576 RepID=UPI001FE05A58|nr:hypothetical protein [Nitrosomonas halophila]
MMHDEIQGFDIIAGQTRCVESGVWQVDPLICHQLFATVLCLDDFNHNLIRAEKLFGNAEFE